MKNSAPICPYCFQQSNLVTGQAIYPHRPDLYQKWFYQCLPCSAFVGCHPNTKNPLGRLANAELRKYKSLAHKAFDPIWKNGEITRKEAYKNLARAMNIESTKCHIGMFDTFQCKKVIAICLNNNLLSEAS